MKEYQVAIVRLQSRAGEDEEAVTDLLNERARMGWQFERMAALPTNRLLVVFARES